MNTLITREYLYAYTLTQLENHHHTLQRRVKDLKYFSLYLGAENDILAREYHELIGRKKAKTNEEHGIRVKLKNAIRSGKDVLVDFFKSAEEEKKVRYEGIYTKQGGKEILVEKVEYKTKEEGMKQRVTMDNVNFDDLYVLGKEKMVGLFKGKTERRKIFDLRKEDNLKDGKEQYEEFVVKPVEENTITEDIQEAKDGSYVTQVAYYMQKIEESVRIYKGNQDEYTNKDEGYCCYQDSRKDIEKECQENYVQKLGYDNKYPLIYNQYGTYQPNNQQIDKSTE